MKEICLSYFFIFLFYVIFLYIQYIFLFLINYLLFYYILFYLFSFNFVTIYVLAILSNFLHIQLSRTISIYPVYDDFFFFVFVFYLHNVIFQYFQQRSQFMRNTELFQPKFSNDIAVFR